MTINTGPGSNIRWVLHCSVSDLNCTSKIPLLTDEELLYCIEQESRKSLLAKLYAEARRRKLAIPKSSAK